MREQNRKESRQKGKQKQKRNRKYTLQKTIGNLTQIVGDYTVHLNQIIGEGTYGRVYKATKIGSEEQFACKLIKQEKIDDQQLYYHDKKVAQELQARLKTEGEFQLKLSKCPHIARMYKTEKTQKGFYFIMEYCETDLAKLIKKEGFLSEGLALRYFKQIVQGIKYIYQKNAFHRDLKPENLLLKNDMIKISDFGFVKIFTQIDKQCKSRRARFQTQSKVGTFRYMSPDILLLLSAQTKDTKKTTPTSKGNQNQQTTQKQNQSISSNEEIQSKYDPEKSDVWSLGIILYKMLYGKEPYDGRSFEEMIKKINEQKLDFPGSIQIVPGKIVKTKVSKQITKLIKKMLTPDQTQRINFMKLYTKINNLLQERQKQKQRSGIQQEQAQNKKTQNDETNRNKKQKLLNVYNKIIVRIYKDLSTFATLRQIGIQNYSQFSYKIMTLLHQKRTLYLQSEQDDSQRTKKKIQTKKFIDIDQKVKQQISQYHNVFYEQIKSLANIQPQEDLKSLLTVVYKFLTVYEDFELLIKEVQLFLLFLLQLLCLEMGIIKEDYICATEDKAQTLKIKSILNFKSDSMKLITDYQNNQNLKGLGKIKQSSKQRSKSKQKGLGLNQTGLKRQKSQSQTKAKNSKRSTKKQTNTLKKQPLQ